MLTVLFEAVSSFRNKTKIQNDQWKEVLFWFRTIISLLVDCASFRNTSEMTRVKCFDWQLQRNGNECKVLCSSCLSLCMVPTLFVSRPFAKPNLKKQLKLFLHDQCHLLYLIFFTAQTMMPTGVFLLFLGKGLSFRNALIVVASVKVQILA